MTTVSEHFKVNEVVNTSSKHLQKLNKDSFLKDQTVQANAKRVCCNLLEPMRKHFVELYPDKNIGVIIHSFYRCPELDEYIGGVTDAHGNPVGQHPKGEAVDFHVRVVSKEEVFEWIWYESGIRFGQLIDEPSWIHLSVPNERRKGEVKIMRYTAERSFVKQEKIYKLFDNGVNFQNRG